MEKRTLKSYVKATTLTNKVIIINAWEEDRGAEVEEYIYNLEDMEEYSNFINLYGSQTAERCKKEGRFWFGGNAYYANEEDKKMSRTTKIWCVNELNIDNILSDNNVLGEILDLFEKYVKSQNNYYNGIVGAISAISGIFYNLIDFKSFYENEYNPKKYKWVVVSNDECYFAHSEGEFESEKDCYNDMRNSALEKMKWNTEYKEDFAECSAEDYINYGVRFYKEKIVHTSYSGVYMYKIIPANIKTDIAFLKEFAKEVRLYTKNEGLTY